MKSLKLACKAFFALSLFLSFPTNSQASLQLSPALKQGHGWQRTSPGGSCSRYPNADNGRRKVPQGQSNPDPEHIKGVGGTTARRGAGEMWVFPRNESPQDAANIQWAVNHVTSGGIVFLMATDPAGLVPTPFYFGYGANSDRIVLGERGNDVHVIGQTQLELDPLTRRPTCDVLGTPTVIKGGHNTFVSGATGEDVDGVLGSNVFGDRTPKIDLTIEGIIFEECFEMCVWVPGSIGLEVSGNKFIKPRLLALDDPHPLGHPVFFGLGPDPETIEWVRENEYGLPMAGVTDHDVSGEVRISGNCVEGEAFSSSNVAAFGPDDYPVLYRGTYYSGASNGLGYSQGVDANVVIENNTIDTFHSSGIYAISNKGSGNNTTIVRNNAITQGHHGWWRYALLAEDLASGDILDNTILETDGVIWIESTSGLAYRANTVTGGGQAGIAVNGTSTNNVIDVKPGELDGFAPTSFHVRFAITSTGNILNLNGTAGLTIIDEDTNTINP